ncbi:MAG: hypothetical protein ACR65O_04810 [Methylomicrobium sp.]
MTQSLLKCGGIEVESGEKHGSQTEDEGLRISEDEYLQGELIGDIKHEYIDGHVYAMAGASKNQ